MHPFAYLFSLETFGMKFGLANIRLICAALGDPQTHYPSVLIAGTNGKGSVTAMVDTALRSAGLKTGRYTSPHLLRLEERFSISGNPVDTGTLAEAVEQVRGVIDGLLADGSLEAHPTFFEVTTAVAFELFKRAGIEIAVLEVGLGGRLDSTNSVEPVAAAITSIAFDHERHLGSTLAAIAAEKAGVIRAGIPVVIGPMPTEAHDVIVSLCKAARADLVEVGSAIETEARKVNGRAVVRLKTSERDYGRVTLGLRGVHQVPNALVAVGLLERLAERFPISPDAIVAGVQEVDWPGRLQMLETASGQRVLLDAAHNPAGMEALSAFLHTEFPGRLPVVFGAMQDKDAGVMLKTLLPSASYLVTTEPHNPRARPAAELASIARALSPACVVEFERDPGDALTRAWSHGPLICVAGSLFLVADALAVLGPSARTI